MRAEDLLPEHQNKHQFQDGTVIRKGTVGAFLINAKVWCDLAAEPAQRAEAERDIVEALPALRLLGLFDVLSIRDADLQHFVETH